MSISLWIKDGFEISTDIARVDKDWLLGTLAKSYWAAENTPDTIWKSIINSRPYGVYAADGHQVGFARLATDMARFAWVSDVLIDPAARGHGLGKWLMDTMTSDPELETVHLWMLGTDDAHGLYEQYGFEHTAKSAIGDQFMHMRREKR
jgi:GNAT superfamily N-acetyltransferase